MIVVALNGFTNRDTRSSVAGFTRTVLEHEPGPAADALFVGMGGAGAVRFARLLRDVEHEIKRRPGQRLVLIGHSYGAHWCRRLLWRLSKRRVLDDCDPYLLAIDPQYLLTALRRQSRRVPDSTDGICYRQPGTMGGYAITGGTVHTVTLADADHSGIVAHPSVRMAIRLALGRL